MVDKEVKPITPEIKEEESTTDVFPIKKNLTTLQTQIDETNLKKEVVPDDVEAKKLRTYELIKDSTMHDKLFTILWSESKVESFALEIDKVVRKYLDQELEWFSNTIKNSMCVGIQFAMMETLTKQWTEWATEFFDAFSKTKSTSAKKSFEWLYNSFGKLWSANEFFVLANKVQNITRYLSDKKNIIIASKNIPKLMNPAKFKTLLNDPVWANQTQIDKLDINTILTLNSSNTAVDVKEGENELKKIVNNPEIEKAITEKSITAIQKSLKSADKLLDNRAKFQDKATTLLDKVGGILGMDIPWLGTLGSLIWMEFPADILWKRQDNKLLNFVFGVLGFHGGLKWLHREYIKEKLDDLHIDNTFVAAAYTAFQKNADAAITNDSETSTWKICGLAAPDTKTEPAMKAKIPADYAGLKKSIVDNLDTTKLNPVMVNKFAKDAVSNDVVDVSKITDKDAFVDEYLKYIIPLLVDTKDDFITSKKIDPSSFALAVMGGLVWDKYFIEWVNIWLISTTDFIDVKKSADTTIIPEAGKEISTKKEFISYIKKIITTWESAGEYGAVNPYDVSGVSLWLLQWHDVRAKELLVKMQTTYPADFATIMGNDFKDLTAATLWTTKWDADKITKFQTLMKADKFQKIMDGFLETDIKQYITNATDHGITDPAMIVYYSYMQNAWTTWAKDVLNSLSTKDFKSLHEKLLASKYIKNYPAIGKKFQTLYTDLAQKDFTGLDKNLA